MTINKLHVLCFGGLSAYVLETVFFYLFTAEPLQGSSSASPHKPVSVASHPQIAQQSQK